MRDQVHFRETRCLHVPAIGLHRNMVLEQIARLGASVDAPVPLRLGRLQPSVHLPCADLEQLLLAFRSQTKAFADPRHPPGQQRFQSHRPGVTRRFPHRRQHRQGLLAIAHPASPRSSASLLRPRSVQQTDRIFPVVPGVCAELAQNHFLALPSCVLIPLINRSQIFPSPFVSQPDLLKNALWLGYILNGATLSASVTF